MTPSTAKLFGTVLLVSLLASGCSSIRIDPIPVAAVQTPATATAPAKQVAGRKVVVIPSASHCLVSIDPYATENLKKGLAQKAESALTTAGYTVLKDITPDKAPADAYSLFLNARCNGYESRGAWLGILSLSVLPAWGHQAITVDLTMADPQRKVLGRHTQAHRMVWAYSGYTPLGLMLGNKTSPEYLGNALDLSPALVHSLMTP